ncbi:unnamed protein product [Paramecium sonneborni]|uniref:Calcineurin-like phosphoesterase domain-containing protein n=1 Tax=Paramecium sonneborni TaxID=65129 RepID=A0A8S1MHI2_9CILI|nr:unnamed protein product [Paramecium sonneborni]
MNELKIVCLSDTHSKFVDVQNGDVLIHCGDFTNWGHEQEIKDFISWLKAQPHKYKIVVPGNHDVILDIEKYPFLKKKFHRYSNYNPDQLLQDLKECCHLLINSSVTIEGFKFWGSPYTLEYCDWAFQIQGSSQQFWEQIEEGSDVIITHGPPFYYGDKTNYGLRVGDRYLAEKVKKIRPKLHVFGGIHEAYGVYEEEGGYRDDNCIKFVNCSIMDHQFKIQNKPYVYHLKQDQ